MTSAAERAFRDSDGLDVHTTGTRRSRLAGSHGVVTVEARTIYRAVCVCGKVFEAGREARAQQRLEAHMASLSEPRA